MSRIMRAIILNEPYAGMVKDSKKTIETRMRNLSQLQGDIIICCDGNKSKHSKNAGKALCVVFAEKGRLMVKEDEKGACIECIDGRIAYPLSNLRHFSYEFLFSKYKVSGTYQGIFQIKIPDFVEIIFKTNIDGLY